MPVQSTDVAILGVDVGGTFTDAVLVDEGRIRTAKVPTAARQEESVLAAARTVMAGSAGGEAAGARPDDPAAFGGRGATGLTRFAHGTTVATNALLERRDARAVLGGGGAPGLTRSAHGPPVETNAPPGRRGARTAYVGNAGFEHLLHLRRQTRAHLYRLFAEHPEPLVPLERCHGVRGRLGPEGELEPLELGSLPDVGDAEAGAGWLPFSLPPPPPQRAAAAGPPRRPPRAPALASPPGPPPLPPGQRA